MTGRDVKERVWRLLGQEPDNDRWPWSKMKLWVSDGIIAIRKARPEARYDENGDIRSESVQLVDDETGTVPLSDHFIIPLVFYVTARCFQEDAGDRRDNKRAEQHMQNFATFIAI